MRRFIENVIKRRRIFVWGCLDPSTRKIVEGGTTFWWVYMQKFQSCGAQVEKDLEGIKI